MSRFVTWLKRRYWLVLVIMASVWAVLVIFPLKTNPGEPQALFNLGCSTGGCIVEPWTASNRSEYRLLGRRYNQPPQNTSTSPPSPTPGNLTEYYMRVSEYHWRAHQPPHPRENLSFWSKWKYKHAFRKYPDAISCLNSDAWSEQGYDLLGFDWRTFRDSESLKVCLSNIHNVIANPAISARWFEAFGFSTEFTTNPERHFRAGWTTIFPMWRRSEDFPAPYVTGLTPRLLFGSGFSMAIQLDAYNQVQNVSVTFNMK